VEGSGFRVQSSEFRVQDSGFFGSGTKRQEPQALASSRGEIKSKVPSEGMGADIVQSLESGQGSGCSLLSALCSPLSTLYLHIGCWSVTAWLSVTSGDAVCLMVAGRISERNDASSRSGLIPTAVVIEWSIDDYSGAIRSSPGAVFSTNLLYNRHIR
jgi:hypothetical protein